MFTFYYSPYVHTTRTDLFTNSDWEKITKSKLIQTRTLTDQEHRTQEEEPRTQGLDLPEHVPPQRGRSRPPTLFLPRLPLLLTREIEDVILRVVSEIYDLPWQAFSTVRFPNRN